MNMDNKIAAQMTDLTKKMLASMTSLQKINDRTVQDLAKQQLDAAEKFISTGTEQLKGIGNVKTVQEAVATQAEMASEIGKLILTNAQKSMEVLTRGQSELKNLMEENLKDLMNKAKAGTE